MKRAISNIGAMVFLLAAVIGPVAAQETVSPAPGEFSAIMFEDQWPCAGDADYNDALIRVNTVVTHNGPDVSKIEMTVFPQAIGSGSLASGLALNLPVSFGASAGATLYPTDEPLSAVVVEPWLNESTLVFTLFDDLKEAYGVTDDYINTDPAGPFRTFEPMRLEINFPDTVEIDPLSIPFDLFFYRTGNRSHQVHRPGYSGTDQMDVSLFNTCDDASADGPNFVNNAGIPWVLFIEESPTAYAWPSEHVNIETAFPNIVDFVESGGASSTDWYNYPELTLVVRESQLPEPTSLAILTLSGLAILRRRGRRL